MTSERSLRRTRFVCVSDTHNQTPKLPKGDVLIHAGDLTNQGSISELRKTVTWLENADFEIKLVVAGMPLAASPPSHQLICAGNHDVTLDEAFYHQHGASFHNQLPQNPSECAQLLESSPTITYLEHEARTIQLTAPAGPRTYFNVFGSPYSPECGKWAFQYNREDGTRWWDGIPLDTDVLITHAPPQFHCDTNSKGLADGCRALREALMRIRPGLHVCGHRHEGRGSERVRWKIDVPMAVVVEERTDIWTDPGTGSNKQSLVDLSVRGGSPIDNDFVHTSPVVSNSVSFAGSTVHQTASSRPDVILANRLVESAFRPFQPPTAIATAQNGEQLISRLHRLGRRETCIVNAAIMAKSYYGNSGPKRFNKPIVVDIDLPVRPGEVHIAPGPSGDVP